MPVGWKPRPAEVAKGRDLGLSDVDVATEAEKFENHHQSKGNVFADWDAAFRNWLINQVNWRRENNGASANGRGNLQHPSATRNYDVAKGMPE